MASETAMPPRRAKPRPFLGILCLICALLAGIALYDYSPQQSLLYTSSPTEQNLIGNVGLVVGESGTLYLGAASWLLVVILSWLSYMFFSGHSHRLQVSKYLAWLLIVPCANVLAALAQDAGVVEVSDPNYFPYGLGGAVGRALYDNFFHSLIGLTGSLVVFGVLLVFSVAMVFHDNLLADLKSRLRKLATWNALREERRAQEKASRTAMAKANRQAKALNTATATTEAKKPLPKTKPPFKEEGPAPLPTLPEARTRKNGQKTEAPFTPIVEAADGEEGMEPEPPAEQLATARGTHAPLRLSNAEPGQTALGSLRIIASEQPKKAASTRPERLGDYVFPPLKLLSEPPEAPVEDTAEMHRQTADQLLQTLDEFGVKVTMGEVHAGPVITRYDVYPAPGVRVEKIANLDKNLALGLKALSVRILAPVPGKGCVGVEIPNKKPQAVFLRDILESEDWVNCKAEIPIALGKEVSGRPLITDLTKMPHLLIAGSTGSGKTVCINAIISSLLYYSSPEDLRFVMVDPKIVEMQVYNSLPHMLIPVVTEPKKVPNALKYLLGEMERRYQTFAQVGVRNIAGYNAKMAKTKAERDEAERLAEELDASLSAEERVAASNIEVPRQLNFDEELPHKLPYIVCIVDELADLMMVAPADIETGIARLAQLARAAGIHLILATQRPSVNVITGVIKANLPSRIAFKVASKVDSRTILDTMGADHLIGKGDMLFLPPGSADLIRIQGAFVSDDEITHIVEHIKEKNGEPVFDELFQRQVEVGDDEEGDGGEGEDEADWDDSMVPQAIAVIKSSRRASTSMLQRRLKIGYNRAARIMEILEKEGMVGPDNGPNPREILMELD